MGVQGVDVCDVKVRPVVGFYPYFQGGDANRISLMIVISILQNDKLVISYLTFGYESFHSVQSVEIPMFLDYRSEALGYDVE